MNNFFQVANSPLAKFPLWVYSLCLATSTYFVTHLIFTNLYCSGYQYAFVFLVPSSDAAGTCEVLTFLSNPINFVLLGAMFTGGLLLLLLLIVSVVAIVLACTGDKQKRKIILLPSIYICLLITVLVFIS